MSQQRVVYGRHPVEALVQARPETIRTIWFSPGGRDALEALAKQRGLQIKTASPDQLERLAKSSHHQGVVAQAEPFAWVDVEDFLPAPPDGLLLALDSVQDPHNFGALVRSAECLGATGVVVPRDRAAGVTPTVSKASSGAVERVPIAQVVNLARALGQLQKGGYWVTGLAGEAGEPLGRIDLTGPVVLVVGAEGSGLRVGMRKVCDHLASIPMAGETGSLNVSVAGSIALYEAARQRRLGTGQSA